MRCYPLCMPYTVLVGDRAHQRGWEQCLASLTGRSAIDVGANEGGYTADFLSRGPRRVVAVEPGPRMATALRAKFADDARVVVRAEGLSDAPGVLHGVKHHNCWTLARPGQFANRLQAVSPGAEAFEGTGTFDVTLTTLDALVDELRLDDLAFVKIDVDGYEPQVIRGARETLTRIRPSGLLELSYLPQDLGESIEDFIDEIYSLGYTLATLEGRTASRSVVLENFPWTTSLDMLMVPVEKVAEYGWPAL